MRLLDAAVIGYEMYFWYWMDIMDVLLLVDINEIYGSILMTVPKVRRQVTGHAPSDGGHSKTVPSPDNYQSCIVKRWIV